MAQPTIQTCKLLDWDTQFFNKRIARVIQPVLTEESAQAAVDWCKHQEIDCLYYLVSSQDVNSIRIVEKLGFNLTDIRMTYTLLPPYSRLKADDASIRHAISSDIPSLREIARQAYRGTRFFNDTRFNVDLSEKLYMTWIEKSCDGYAQAVFVAGPGSEAAGYITCDLDEDVGQIGLLGVLPERRGQGWGKKLVVKALDWFASQNCNLVKVVTQGNNLISQRLYERCGFTIETVELWYHRWFS